MISDTIFAPSSGSAPSGIAIIRISGPKARAVLESFSGLICPKPRIVRRASMFDPKTGDALDEGLVIWFPGPGSFTGEDVVEFHIHGGRATIEAVCRSLSDFDGCRLAGPGEFSRRAFDNDKLDLTEIEGLADLIAAETEGQRKQALKQLSGGLSMIYEAWRKKLLRLLAHAEAAIDFPDEELPDNLISNTIIELKFRKWVFRIKSTRHNSNLLFTYSRSPKRQTIISFLALGLFLLESVQLLFKH